MEWVTNLNPKKIMQKTLRNRLILSHALPLIITIPLMGITLFYLLETQVLLPSLSRESVSDAVMLTEILKSEPEWWQEESSIARETLLSTYPRLTKRVMLVSPQGYLLASSDPQDNDRLNQILNTPSLQNPPTSAAVVSIRYSRRLQSEVIDVLAPVSSSSGELLGFVRVSSPYATIVDELRQLRYVIGLVTALGLVLGAVVGSTLAINIGNPVQQVTQAILHLTRGERKESLAENGPQEIRQLIHAVNGLVERLRSLEQSRRQLLANLVHELGRPLGSLRMAVQVLLSGSKENPAQLDELLQGIDLEMENLQRLLDDLALLHEQVLGPLELDLKTLSLSQWLPTILHPWKEAARQKGIEWVVSLPAGLPAVQADPIRFSQIVGNLMSNAIKFTPAGGQIELTAGVGTDKLWIRVSDNGLGIAIEEQEKIFKPFYQGQQRTRFSEGMGLGLFIVRDLVQAHRGTIILESKPGEGSRFTIFLPLSLRLTS